MGVGPLVEAATIETISPGRRRRLRDRPVSVLIGGAILALMVICGALAPLIARYSPYQLDFSARLLSPSVAHWFGTDENGRDVFTRCLYALRLDLLVAVAVTYVPLPIGVLVGATAGHYGGVPDAVIARLTDIMLSFPFIVLVIAVIAVVGPGLRGVLIGVPIVSWALYARIARAEMLVIRELAYVDAAVVLGFSNARIILRHAIPNLIRTSLVYSTVDMMANLLLLAGLSYLGLGAQPPTPELGAIIAEGQPYLLTSWWIAALPGLLLVIFGLGVAMVGEGLSDARLSGGPR